jgi:quinol monooxygenase YgiN
MIIIAGTVDIDPDKRAAALESARELLEPTRAQPGCLHYVWSADPVVEGRLYVYECWESRDTLAAHLSGKWYRAMLATISAHDIRKVAVQKFRIDVAEPVYGPDGVATANFSTPAP